MYNGDPIFSEIKIDKKTGRCYIEIDENFMRFGGYEPGDEIEGYIRKKRR